MKQIVCIPDKKYKGEISVVRAYQDIYNVLNES